MRGLRKPTVAAWAANQLARRHEKEMQALLRAGDELRGAHERLLSGKGGDAVGAAAAGEREAVARLLERARELDLSDPVRERLAETLHAAAGSEELREELRRGVVTREHQAASFGAGFSPAGGAPARAKDNRAARERERKREQERERKERLKAARAELRRLRSEHGKARRALDSARREEERARERVAAAEAEADRLAHGGPDTP